MSGGAFPTTSRDWLEALIAFDTTSRNSNLPLIDLVERYLRSHGLTCHRVPNPEGTKANLFATLPASDGATNGGIVLSGHTDVVPVDGQKWDSDPFKLAERDGNLYGRGTCDMKGFLAVALALLPRFAKMTRAKPVHYAFSYDEELGCLGVPLMVDFLKQRGFTADACLIGEPTEMRVCTGSKGRFTWEVTVNGKAIHSSLALMNTSCNAIEYAAQLITKIREIAKELRERGPRDDDYACPFAPISTGLIKGGNAVNTVPAQCDFTFSVRVTDPTTAKSIEDTVRRYVEEEILPSMRAEFAGAHVHIKQTTGYPAYNADETNTFTKKVRDMRKDTVVLKMGGGTEAGYIQDRLGVPTVVVGPGLMTSAHQPNEFVSLEQMQLCEQFTFDLVSLHVDSKYASSSL